MTLKNQYDQEGYVILERAIAPERVTCLLSTLVPSARKTRKASLIDDPSVVKDVDALVRPLFLALNFPVNTLVELHALLVADARPVKLSWHRDRPEAQGVYSFQMPLLPGDTFHQIVPGTHRRELSAEEVTARNAGGHAMPGALVIALESGTSFCEAHSSCIVG